MTPSEETKVKVYGGKKCIVTRVVGEVVSDWWIGMDNAWADYYTTLRKQRERVRLLAVRDCTP